MMLVGLRDAVSPDGLPTDSWTIPEKPLTEVAVIDEVPVEPAKKVRELGLADRV